MPIYNLIEYSSNYLKNTGRLCQYYRDNPNKNTLLSESFKFKTIIKGKTPDAGNTKDVEIAGSLKF